MVLNNGLEGDLLATNVGAVAQGCIGACAECVDNRTVGGLGLYQGNDEVHETPRPILARDEYEVGDEIASCVILS